MYLRWRPVMSRCLNRRRLLRVVVSKTSIGLNEKSRWMSPGTKRHKFLGTSGSKLCDRSKCLTLRHFDKKCDEVFWTKFRETLNLNNFGRGKSGRKVRLQLLISKSWRCRRFDRDFDSKTERALLDMLSCFKFFRPENEPSFNSLMSLWERTSVVKDSQSKGGLESLLLDKSITLRALDWKE